MNERMRQLELQSYVTLTKAGLDGRHEKTSTIFDREKFAELIVRECIDVIYNGDEPNYTIVKNIQKHFGVE